jgi:hypothetical protein
VVVMAMSGALLSGCGGCGSSTGSASSPCGGTTTSYRLGRSIAACLVEIAYVEGLKATVDSEEI